MAAVRRAYLGLGSNLGARVAHVRDALRALERLGRVHDTSSLVASTAWVPSGWAGALPPDYVNGACALDTKLSPAELLRGVKALEEELGRAPSVRYGPRPIDIDVLAFDDGASVHEEDVLPTAAGREAELRSLTVPHPRMHERAFVLQPLAELAPALRIPGHGATVAELLAALGEPPLPRVLAARRGSAGAEEAVWRLGEQSFVMGVLNVTPDSFSDGGEHATRDAARRAAARLVADGADLLDIGGASSRPGAAPVPEAEEAARVVPLIEALRSDGVRAPISVDTTSAAVARAALGAGADMVNDVSAGAHDAAMLPTVARLGAPVVLMHMRGTAASMQALATYDEDGSGGVVAAVCAELGARVEHAVREARVPRFDLLVDPGIGFAKTAVHNWQLLAALPEVRAALRGAPLVLGVSRKRFLGELLDEPEPKRRGWGTAGASACAVPAADVHRVHDVAEIKQVLAVADRIRRV